VPSITPSDDCMDFVRVYTEEDYRSLPSGLWGIPDPTPGWSGKKRQSGASNLHCKTRPILVFQVFDADCSNLDVILVPGRCRCIDMNNIRRDQPLFYYRRCI
jgi:5-formyltetrahydrofolate cyclo-ligase